MLYYRQMAAGLADESGGLSDYAVCGILLPDALPAGQESKGDESAGSDYYGTSGCGLLHTDVSVFSGESALCLYGSQCACARFSFLPTNITRMGDCVVIWNKTVSFRLQDRTRRSKQ